MVFITLCILALWMKLASALEGLRVHQLIVVWFHTLDNKFLQNIRRVVGYVLINISPLTFFAMPANIF